MCNNNSRIETTITYVVIHLNQLLVLGIISMSIFFSLPILPRIVDVSWPMNESRRYSSLQIWTEYFIDQERYFYLLILHMYAAVYVGATAMLSTGAMLIIYAQHVCGMFKVARWEHNKRIQLINKIHFVIRNYSKKFNDSISAIVILDFTFMITLLNIII
jgi:hypothetical protein